MVIEDGLRKIKVDNHVLNIIRQYCQVRKNMPESGGILIGRENISNENLIIESLSEPMSNDRQTRTRFTRKDSGHIIMFQKQYAESDKTVRYVGEWHTHPEDDPHYSVIDLANWKKLIKDDSSGQSQYHLIAGRRFLTMWKYSNEKCLPIKIATLDWEEIREGNI